MVGSGGLPQLLREWTACRGAGPPQVGGARLDHANIRSGPGDGGSAEVKRQGEAAGGGSL